MREPPSVRDRGSNRNSRLVFSTGPLYARTGRFMSVRNSCAGTGAHEEHSRRTNARRNEPQTQPQSGRLRGVSLRDASRTLETIKVSTASTTRGVAAALAHLVRENRGIEILAGSGRALSTALKACAAARKLLKNEDRDVAVAARLSSSENADESAAPRRTRLYLVPLASIVESGSPGEACASYTVKSNTNPAALAGALTARLREGKTAVVSCVGVDAATRAATALALASQYRTADADDAKGAAADDASARDTTKRVVAVCYFTTETSGASGRAGEEVSVLNLHVRTV